MSLQLININNTHFKFDGLNIRTLEDEIHANVASHVIVDQWIVINLN